jgi:SAM-dependent methyltransferase
MARSGTFDLHWNLYEDWFTRNQAAFESELAAIRSVLPEGTGVEIGVGSGLFAERLDIRDGVEPSPVMAALARKRGIHVCRGVAEDVPYHDASFDFALMVTTICFVDDPLVAIREMKRIVKPGGLVIQAFVDAASPLGMAYEAHKERNVFYKDAVFHPVDEIRALMESAGLAIVDIRQTVFGELGSIAGIQAHEEGHGRGGFVVITGRVQA